VRLDAERKEGKEKAEIKPSKKIHSTCTSWGTLMQKGLRNSAPIVDGHEGLIERERVDSLI